MQTLSPTFLLLVALALLMAVPAQSQFDPALNAARDAYERQAIVDRYTRAGNGRPESSKGEFSFAVSKGWQATEGKGERATQAYLHPIGDASQHLYIAVRELPFARDGLAQHLEEIRKFLQMDPSWRQAGNAWREEWPAGEAWSSRLVNRATEEQQVATHFVASNRMALVMYQARAGLAMPSIRESVLASFQFAGQSGGATQHKPEVSATGGAAGLVGEWEMESKGGGVEASLTFLANGRYRYRVGMERVWKLEHEGTYALRGSHQPDRNDAVLVLTPTAVVSEPSMAGQEWVRTRYMMDNKGSGRKYWLMPSSRDPRNRITLCESPYGDVTCASAWTLVRR